MGFGLAELIVLLALGVAPVTATSVTAVNPLFGLASSAYFRSPTALASGVALMLFTGRKAGPVTGPVAVIAPPVPPAVAPPIGPAAASARPKGSAAEDDVDDE